MGRTTMGTLAMVGAAMLALLIVPGLAVPASATPTPLSGAASQQWAYGAQKWVNVSATYGNATYDAHAFFGWHVVWTATNTSATTTQLEVQRTVQGSYYADLCSPNCANATNSGNLTIVGWETDTGFANLTDAATVTMNGSQVPAVGLLNANAQVAGNISESLTLVLAHHGTSKTSLNVAGSAHASVSLTPALGLVPINVSTGDRWNSSSAFAAAGAWTIGFTYAHQAFGGGLTSAARTVNGSVNASGTVNLAGGDLGAITLANGATVPVIALAWSGPFDDVDGVILVPHDFDLFGSGDHAWAGDALGSESVATTQVDVSVDAAHRMHIVAAATAFDSSDSSLATQSAPSEVAGPASASSGPTVLQAQPESVSAAQQGSSCLLGHCTAPAASTGNALALGLIVGLVVVVVVGSVSVIEYRVWARRRAERGSPAAGGPIRNVTHLPPNGAVMGNPANPPPPATVPGPRYPPQNP
jgi:hypothetical protein